MYVGMYVRVRVRTCVCLCDNSEVFIICKFGVYFTPRVWYMGARFKTSR